MTIKDFLICKCTKIEENMRRKITKYWKMQSRQTGIKCFNKSEKIKA